MKVVLTTLAFLVPATTIAHAHPHAKGCNTGKCDKRVWIKHKKKTIKPYEGWLKRLRQCESTNRRTAHSSNGLYHGYYQFSIRTWQSIGGKGDPHTQGLLEQSYRAVLLLKRSGVGQWPHCGPRSL